MVVCVLCCRWKVGAVEEEDDGRWEMIRRGGSVDTAAQLVAGVGERRSRGKVEEGGRAVFICELKGGPGRTSDFS